MASSRIRTSSPASTSRVAVSRVASASAIQLAAGRLAQLRRAQGLVAERDHLGAEAVRLAVRALQQPLAFEGAQQAIGGGLVEPLAAAQVAEPRRRVPGAGLQEAHGPHHGLGARIRSFHIVHSKFRHTEQATAAPPRRQAHGSLALDAHLPDRRVRSQLLRRPRPRRDRRHRGRHPRHPRLHAARRGPRPVHEPDRVHLRGRAGSGRGGRPGRRPAGPRPHRHAAPPRRAPADGRPRRLPFRPRERRDHGRLRRLREGVRPPRRRRARHPRLPVRGRVRAGAPQDAEADPGRRVRGAAPADRAPGLAARLRPRRARPGLGGDGHRRARVPHRVQRQRPRDQGAGPPHRARRARAGARAGPAGPAEGGQGHRLVGRGVRDGPGLDEPRRLHGDPAPRRLRSLRRGGAPPEGRGRGLGAGRPDPAARVADGRRPLHREGEAVHPRRAAEDPARGGAPRPLLHHAVRPRQAHH